MNDPDEVAAQNRELAFTNVRRVALELLNAETRDLAKLFIESSLFPLVLDHFGGYVDCWQPEPVDFIRVNGGTCTGKRVWKQRRQMIRSGRPAMVKYDPKAFGVCACGAPLLTKTSTKCRPCAALETISLYRFKRRIQRQKI